MVLLTYKIMNFNLFWCTHYTCRETTREYKASPCQPTNKVIRKNWKTDNIVVQLKKKKQLKIELQLHHLITHANYKRFKKSDLALYFIRCGNRNTHVDCFSIIIDQISCRILCDVKMLNLTNKHCMFVISITVSSIINF